MLQGCNHLFRLKRQHFTVLCAIFLLSGCFDETVWNRPYSSEQSKLNIYYTSFSERPKHLDPAASYSSNEWVITAQIYEPLLQYHYLKRPYTLEPLVAESMPSIQAFDSNNKPVSVLSPSVAVTEYKIKLKPGIMFAPHPAFYSGAKDSVEERQDFRSISDFKKLGTRELITEDFVYQIKRLADPKLNSPIYGHMGNYILGLKALREQLESILKKDPNAVYDLRDFQIEGAKAEGPYNLTIRLKGYYPQFLYWLAMPFFSPMPHEAVKFYDAPDLIDKNISLDWYPVGTGPFALVNNNPSLDILLVKNQNFRGEKFPETGTAGTEMAKLAGQSLPFLDKIIFSLEKESIPRWNKFIQGYYDASGISSDNFDQALQLQGNSLALSDELKSQNIRLEKEIGPAVHYWAVNMLDPLIGGNTQSAKKLRKAISLTFDMDEYINIFLNGRGIKAHSPLPPEIFGYRKMVKGSEDAQSTLLTRAKQLMREAGYPDGIDPKTGQPLILNLDARMDSGPDAKEEFNWIRKQFNKLGINLIIRATQYNRFQDKMSRGNAQIFSWGWSADYPDPENFLFLLFGPNGKVKFGGENASNYQNDDFDKLFLEMKKRPNGEERQQLIDKMLLILAEDTPWIAGFHPESFSLLHSWIGPTKANAMTHNTLKYLSIDAKKRYEQQNSWNQPILWPIILFVLGLCILILPAYWQYRFKINSKLKLRPETNG